MSEAPYGYHIVNGEMVAHPFESKIVRLTNGLSQIGLESSDIQSLLEEFKVPKRGEDYNYDIDGNLHKIYVAGAKVLIDLIQEKIDNEIVYLPGDKEKTHPIVSAISLADVFNKFRGTNESL
ncbi:hypothetical protein IAQ67_16440 [Paenibacillus peoriae]|uniref:Uncharacterized protein n=1 Tax=Paenibacillus peoriae TaxID=59893 RepID=A0A7H0Y317_9BACL|nr:hypothetical protein [Paenibacillus peoriae]QNR65475.1 hypothetical protein IAQ67_16440 [Paenibacillus peoriae]